MGGTLTSLRPDHKPVVLWTPWGAIPRTGFHGRQADPWIKLQNAIGPLRREPASKDEPRKPS